MIQNLAHTWLLVAWIILFFRSECSVSWLSLGADRIVSVCTPRDDHYVELVAGASAGPGWRGVCGSNDVSVVVPNGSAHRFFFGSRAVDSQNFFRSRPMDPVLIRSGASWTRRDARDPSQSWTITLSPSRGSELG